MIIDTIVSAGLPLIGVVIGVLISYFLSRMKGRSERIIEGVYRPLLGAIGRKVRN